MARVPFYTIDASLALPFPLAGIHPFSLGPVYSATKFGVVGFTQSLKVSYLFTWKGFVLLN